jgi:hypothetical protein
MFKRLILPGFTPRWGSAASRDTGTSAGQIPLLTSTGLPAVSGVALTEFPLPPGHLTGFGLSNNGTDAVNDIDIAAGACRDSTNVANITLASAITKKLDASWAVGTDQGGLDGSESVAGTPDVSTWYHVHAILRTDTGVVDVLFSESATAPTLPADYDYFRRIGAVFNDSSGDILPFSQLGDEFLWLTMISNLSTATGSTAGALVTISVPLGVKVTALLNVSVAGQDGGSRGAYISSPDVTNVGGAPNTIGNTAGATVAVGAAAQVRVRTDTSSQIRYRTTEADDIAIATTGWLDRRGRDD